MDTPSRLILHDYGYALDGGTTVLQGTDESGCPHSVVLVQHRRTEPSPSLRMVPGRLYLDGVLVPMRSSLEGQVLELLRTAEVRYVAPADQAREERLQLSPHRLVLGDDIQQVLTRSPEENLRGLAGDVIAFVESEQYLAFAVQVDQAQDPTLYQVRVDWAGRDRMQAIVALGRVLHLTMQAARQVLDDNRPVTCAVKAPEVARLAAQLQAAGLGVRVEPEFRWRFG